MTRFDILHRFQAKAEASGAHLGLMYEDVVRAVYEAWLKPGDLAVDVGAYKGMHLFPMADAVGARGKVIAFEPAPKMHKALKRAIKKNGYRQIKLHQLALGQTAEQSEFHFFENRPAFSGLKRRQSSFTDAEGGLERVLVKRVRLDSKLPLFRRVSAIKLDIEGGELHALMGAEKCLKKSRPMLVFENGRQDSADVYGYAREDFFGFFERMNYQVFWLSGEPFSPDDWQANVSSWEFVALPKENTAFAERLPTLCKVVLAKSA